MNINQPLKMWLQGKLNLRKTITKKTDQYNSTSKTDQETEQKRSFGSTPFQ